MSQLNKKLLIAESAGKNTVWNKTGSRYRMTPQIYCLLKQTKHNEKGPDYCNMTAHSILKCLTGIDFETSKNDFASQGIQMVTFRGLLLILDLCFFPGFDFADDTSGGGSLGQKM